MADWRHCDVVGAVQEVGALVVVFVVLPGELSSNCTSSSNDWCLSATASPRMKALHNKQMGVPACTEQSESGV